MKRFAAVMIGIILIMSSECVLRLTGINTAFEQRSQLISDIMRKHDILFWSLVPNLDIEYRAVRIKTGPLGFRGILTDQPDEGYRILCLGDSVTFGWDVKDGETYPAVLQDLLRQKSVTAPPVVINAGVPGYTSHQCLLYFTQYLEELQPQIVVLSCGINDRFTGMKTDAQRSAESRKAVYKLINKLQKLQLSLLIKRILQPEMRTRAGESGDTGKGSVLRVPVDDFTHNIRSFIATARSKQFKLILMNQKITSENQHNEHQNRMHELAKEYHIPFIDVAAMFDEVINHLKTEVAPETTTQKEPDIPDMSNSEPKKKMVKWNRTLMSLKTDERYTRYFVDNYHPNADGYRIIAEKLAETIKEQ